MNRTTETTAALTIAGSDSSGGAGIQADLRAFSAFGLKGLSAVTAVTAQHGRVLASEPVSPGLVRAQIDAAAASGTVAAVKTGMLASAEVVRAVVEALDAHRLRPLVVDPVRSATGGGSLLDELGAELVVRELVPRCTVLTPNIPEAEALLDARVRGRPDMAEAAAALAGLGAPAVLLKGGHLAGPDSPDVLCEGGRITWFEGPRILADDSHGTGCALSAAIAAQLALGRPLVEACAAARSYVVMRLAGSTGGAVRSL